MTRALVLFAVLGAIALYVFATAARGYSCPGNDAWTPFSC